MTLFRKSQARAALAAAAFSAVVAFADADAPTLKLGAPFSDHMVLQRDSQLPIWGTAPAGHKIVGALDIRGEGAPRKRNAKLYSSVAGPDGKWKFELDPVSGYTGTNATLRVRDVHSGEQIVLTDVAIGDVWICGGQSNMDMPSVWRSDDFPGKEEIATADFPEIRLFKTPRITAGHPQEDLRIPAEWTRCTPESARYFSLCGLFFGMRMQRELNVPIGLFQDCWSGSIAETWLAMENAEKIKGLESAIERRKRQVAEKDAKSTEEIEAELASWLLRCDPVPSPAAADFVPVAGEWVPCKLPFVFEREIDKDYNGVVWFRGSVNLTAAQAAAAATIRLGEIDDKDDTYVNGVKVGSMDQWQTARVYPVPSGVFHEGVNELAIRVFDRGGNGGLMTVNPELPRIDFEGVGSLSLADAGWTRRAGPPESSRPADPDDNKRCNEIAACYNGMIAPMKPFAVKGAIWYQGCSNVGRHEQYQTLLPEVIAEWRRTFTGAGSSLPFYIVQLAAYRETSPEPRESNWAAFRWGQTKIGRDVYQSGTVVAIDIGEHNDIHPRYKKDVGERLAELALLKTYFRRRSRDGSALHASLLPDAATRAGEAAVAVSFAEQVEGAGGVAVAASDGTSTVRGFQIAGSDRKFVWAEAEAKEDGSLIVRVPAGVDAAFVRYAWDDYPDCNLVGPGGLPVGPFELPVND